MSPRIYKPLSEERKQEISKFHKGKKLSDETKRKISEGRKGMILSEEHKRNISKAKQGITLNLSEEQRRNRSKIRKGENNPFHGKHHSKETKEYLGVLQSQRTLSKETREKIGKAGIGRKPSVETRIKISKGKQGSNNPNYGKVYTEAERIRFGSPKETHPNWKGGISYEPYSPEWTDKLKKSIKERDGNKCKNPECSKKINQLVVHHIDYNKKNCTPENLITLCNSCNAKANYNRDFHQAFYQKLMKKIA